MLKRCSKCKVWKPLSEFSKNKSRKDGLKYWCKQCQSKYSKGYYQKNRKRELAQMYEYRKNHKKEINEYRKAHKDELRRQHSKQRNLGYNPLNNWFKGCVMHHINDIDVVFIPDKIHRKFIGNGLTLDQHRKRILEYYGSLERMITNNPIRRKDDSTIYPLSPGMG